LGEEVAMGKQMGRPRKKGGDYRERKLRQQWREASQRYYRKNRSKVLRKAKRGR